MLSNIVAGGSVTRLLNLIEEAVNVISRVRRVQVSLVLLNLLGNELVDFTVDFLQGLMRPWQTSHQPGEGIVELQSGEAWNSEIIVE